MPLDTRIKGHSYNGAIKYHLEQDHGLSGKNINITDFKILFKFPHTHILQIAEAILIKKLNPDLNKRHEGITRRLFLF